ncbi:hypothetical protein PanWU01x14_211880 [Parasponia andersonii]|uniref:Transmembrane protein n=1 Tax=Parasponia andersonii TaxID=3476 RepID=A0A2P5BTF6_PARAD|nr:hypothetical protein PanWU01x14_211880 [Parasponia andersonii]
MWIRKLAERGIMMPSFIFTVHIVFNLNIYIYIYIYIYFSVHFAARIFFLDSSPIYSLSLPLTFISVPLDLVMLPTSEGSISPPSSHSCFFYFPFFFSVYFLETRIVIWIFQVF